MNKERRTVVSTSLIISTGLIITIAVLTANWDRTFKSDHIPHDSITKNIGNETGDVYNFDDVDKLLEKMEFGVIAFNTPTHINIDDSPQIQLKLSLNETVEKLKRSITEKGKKMGATIRVSDRMEARLSGNMFRITAITPETQAVSKKQETEWKWVIHPKKEGTHKLYLTLTALLEVSGQTTPRAIRTFDKKIAVNVTPTQKVRLFFMNNWQWLWAAILVPVAGWLWKRKGKKRTNT